MTKSQRITEAYASTLEVLDFIVSRTSDSLAEILTKALPLVAPIPNAVSIYYVSQTALSYNAIQALAVAASIECMFFALTEVVLKSWELWHADNQYKFPLIVSVSAFATYFCLVMALVYMLEVTAGHSIAPMAFPVVSVVAAVALGVTRWHKRNSTHKERRLTTATAKAPSVTAAKLKVADIADEDIESVTVTHTDDKLTTDKLSADKLTGSKLTTTERRSKLSQLLLVATATTDTVSQWAQELGTSERTIWRDIQSLTASASGD